MYYNITRKCVVCAFSLSENRIKDVFVIELLLMKAEHFKCCVCALEQTTGKL